MLRPNLIKFDLINWGLQVPVQPQRLARGHRGANLARRYVWPRLMDRPHPSLLCARQGAILPALYVCYPGRIFTGCWSVDVVLFAVPCMIGLRVFRPAPRDDAAPRAMRAAVAVAVDARQLEGEAVGGRALDEDVLQRQGLVRLDRLSTKLKWVSPTTAMERA